MRNHFDRKQEDVLKERTTERRRQRCTDPIIALHYQLAAARKAASLDALVLVDDTGCLVAGSGAWPICEELAAYAPFLADKSVARSQHVARQTAALARQTHVRPMKIDGMDVVLCARGGNQKNIPAQMSRAMSGCQRILALD